MKRQSLKAKEDCSFWSSVKPRKVFPKINYSVKYSLHKFIASHCNTIDAIEKVVNN